MMKLKRLNRGAVMLLVVLVLVAGVFGYDMSMEAKHRKEAERIVTELVEAFARYRSLSQEVKGDLNWNWTISTQNGKFIGEYEERVNEYIDEYRQLLKKYTYRMENDVDGKAWETKIEDTVQRAKRYIYMRVYSSIGVTSYEVTNYSEDMVDTVIAPRFKINRDHTEMSIKMRFRIKCGKVSNTVDDTYHFVRGKDGKWYITEPDISALKI